MNEQHENKQIQPQTGSEPSTSFADVQFFSSNGDGRKKESTSELPMFGLDEALSLVNLIHDQALERATMPQVASAAGYKHASSTPFYRKISAARRFGLVSQTGPELTMRARDILKPATENARSDALVAAILSIPYYNELVELNAGKKANQSLIANGIARTFDITDACANTCAKAFMASLREAGLLTTDGVVITRPQMMPKPDGARNDKQPPSGSGPTDEQDQVEYTLYLDKTKVKKMTVRGPISITPAEYKRLCEWLKVTLIIDPPIDSE